MVLCLVGGFRFGFWSFRAYRLAFRVYRVWGFKWFTQGIGLRA